MQKQQTGAGRVLGLSERRGVRFGAGLLAVLAAALLVACGGSDADSEGGSGGGGGAGGQDPDGGGGGGAVTPGEGEILDVCPEPSGPGTDVPSAITSDETWTPEGSPYRVSANLYLTATLTLEPCTLVELGPEVNVYVGDEPAAGALVARGTAVALDSGDIELRAILFRRLDESAAWSSVTVDSTGSVDLEWVFLDGGGSEGAAQRGGGALLAYGANVFGEPTENVTVRSTFVSGSETYGVNLQNRAAFSPESRDLVITDSGSEGSPFGLSLEAGVAYSIPEGIVLDGNLKDEVRIDTFTTVFEDTLPARDVPLHVEGPIYLQANDDEAESGVAVLTIEPGAEVRFSDSAGSGIYVGSDDAHPGRIEALGTAEAPILLRSANDPPAAADWLGLYFRHTDSGNVLSHVTIAHAGGFSGAQGFGCGPIENHASVLVLTEQPLEPFLDSCTFKDAGGDTQLLLGWSAESDPEGVASAFAAGNNFAASPACTVSLPRDTTNSCPGDSEPDCL